MVELFPSPENCDHAMLEQPREGPGRWMEFFLVVSFLCTNSGTLTFSVLCFLLDSPMAGRTRLQKVFHTQIGVCGFPQKKEHQVLIGLSKAILLAAQHLLPPVIDANFIKENDRWHMAAGKMPVHMMNPTIFQSRINNVFNHLEKKSYHFFLCV